VTVPNANLRTNPPDLLTSDTQPLPGAYTYASHGTVDGPGKMDGTVSFDGIAAEDRLLITAVFHLPKGDITGTGISTDDPSDTEHYAITGGTGKYRHARGDATLTGEQDSDDPNGAETFTLTFRF
jgi:hypothetical protein